jgi:hypothetical protein
MTFGGFVSRNPGAVFARIGAAILGGYALTLGFVTMVIASLVLAGMSFGYAWVLALVLAFLLDLGVFLWAFAARSVIRVWLVLAGGSALMAGAAMVVAQLTTQTRFLAP